MAEDPRLERRLLKHLLQAPSVGVAEEQLVDSVTTLPGLPTLVRQAALALEKGSAIGVLTLNISHFTKLEDVYGWETFDGIVRGFADCLKVVKTESLRADDVLAELSMNGNVFIVMVSPPRTNRVLKFRDLVRIKERVAEAVNQYVERTLSPDMRYRFTYFIGCAMMRRERAVRLERLLYRTIDDALDDATSEEGKLARQRVRKLREILDRRRITTLYQPIVNARTRALLGYEALSRGPAGEFANPDVLFRIAYESDLVLKLDAVCRERAARALGRLKSGELLFINMEPLSVFDPTLMAAIPPRLAAQVVFEVTEHAAIADFATFRQAVQLLRGAGAKFALDDVGSAYSGLRIIAEIEPDFIKLDMQLTRDAHRYPVKLELVRAVAGFCAETKVPMVVEGVESAEELEAVTSVGAAYVQGYYVGRPAAIAAKPRQAKATVTLR